MEKAVGSNPSQTTKKKRNCDLNIKIYVLIDPRTNDIRYVGKTITSLNKRLSRHINDSIKDRNSTHKVCWIKNLISDGYKPIIHLIEENLCEYEWKEREKWYINYYREIGYNLTNLTEGGDGMHGIIMSEETKIKISESLKGRKVSEETKYKLSIINSGRKMTKEQIEKMIESKKGKKLSNDHKNKIRMNMIGEKNHFYGKNHTDESKEKMKISHKDLRNNIRKVVQIDVSNGEIIKIWESATEASRVLLISNKGIQKVCSNKKKTYKGFKWSYFENTPI